MTQYKRVLLCEVKKTVCVNYGNYYVPRINSHDEAANKYPVFPHQEKTRRIL